MGRIGKGVTTSLYLGTKKSNKKQKEGFEITGINNQYLSNFLKKFKIHRI